jgi:LysR family nitrogen assimilation transcriptional regulator
MELKQLEAFVHVVELGSFTRAATILDTNQPTLSRLVRQLEVELLISQEFCGHMLYA